MASVSRFCASGSQIKNLGVKIRQPGWQDGGLRVMAYKWYDIYHIFFCISAREPLGFDFGHKESNLGLC